MTRIAVAVAALIVFTAPVFASDQTDIVSAIGRMNDAMNKNDAKGAGAIYTTDATIIDEFSPHFWSGPHAFDKWLADFATSSTAKGETDGWVTLGKPVHVMVEGDRGYAVMQAVYTYKEKGKKVTENGLWTFAMQKSAGGWQIAGWAWALK